LSRLYLDYNASTPIAPEVVAAMSPLLQSDWGNPSSGHWASRGAAAAYSRAREQVASLIAADPAEIIFTSGGSEANNHALKGVVLRHLRQNPGSRPHIVISAIEHPAVVQPCRYLCELGARLTEVKVDARGRVDPEDVARAIEDDTLLVSVMHANNEVGTVQPIAAIAAAAHRRGVLVHTDAAQSLAKIPVRVDELGVDLLSIAGHKIYAPKGVGALYVKSGIELDSLVHGASHEAGRRAGTENVLLAVGLGAACELAQRDPCGAAIGTLRDRLWKGIEHAFGAEVVLNGHPTEMLPSTLNVSFVGRIGADILALLEGVAASTGSACHAGTRTLSPVLAQMGVSERTGHGAIRFSVGRGTTAAEIDQVLALLREVI